MRQFDAALKRAQQTKKPLLVDFWAEWCGWCHRLDQTTYVDPVVVKMSEDFVAVKVNTEGTPREVAVARHYDVSSLPTIAFLSPAGRMILRLNGFQGPGQFPRAIEEARERATKIIGWEDDDRARSPATRRRWPAWARTSSSRRPTTRAATCWRAR